MSRPIATIHQWNDIHTHSDAVPVKYDNLSQTNEACDWLLEIANTERPDLVLSAGDLIDVGIDEIDGEYEFFNERYLKSLQVPFLPANGNHECALKDYVCDFGQGYDRFFGAHRRQYFFKAFGIGFIVLDTANVFFENMAMADERVTFIDQAMKQLHPLPLVIVSHVPLAPARDPKVLSESFGIPNWIVEDPRVLNRIEDEADRVILVTGGHVHLNAMNVYQGIAHLVVGGMAGSPMSFAQHEIYEDRWVVSVRSGPAEYAKPGIHGSPRHETDYVDDAHPTRELYEQGHLHERDFEIELTGARAPRPEAQIDVPNWSDLTL